VGERWLRAYGGTDHPNMLGGMLAVGLLLLIGKIMAENRVNNFQFSIFNFQTIFNAKIFKIIDWLLAIIFSAALFFSFSRSAWLALAVGLMVMIALAVAGRNLKLQKGLAEIILVTGILLFILFSQYQNLITSRLAGQGRLEEKSTSERLVSYQESWQLIKNNWLFGAGLGNYTLALNRQIPGQESFYYQPTHNVFMLVLSEIGIFGLMFFIGLLFVIASPDALVGAKQSLVKFRVCEIASSLTLLAMTIKNRLLRPPQMRGPRDDKNELAPRNDSKTAILIALVVIMTFDHWLWSLHFGVLFFWLVLGLLAVGKPGYLTAGRFK
jgi:hypothetical protein